MKYTRQEIQDSIKNLETAIKIRRQLSLESLNETRRKEYADEAKQLEVRKLELNILLECTNNQNSEVTL